MLSIARGRARRGVLGALLAMPTALAALAALPAAPAAAAPAVTLYVRAGATGVTCGTPTSACGSIGTAVNLAEGDAGDAVTVTIGAGTYYEHTIDVRAGSVVALRLQGAGSSATVLTAQRLGRAFLLTGYGVKTTRSVTIAGMTVTGGDAGATSYATGLGGGVLVSTLGATFTGDVFSNDTTTNLGGAIAILNNGDTHFPGQPVTVSKTTFVNDKAKNSGGGVFDNIAAGAATFTDDTFLDDSSSSTGGALTVTATQSATVVGSTFSGDTATLRGGALFSFGITQLIGSILDQSSCAVLLTYITGVGYESAGGIIGSAYDVSTTGGTCVSAHLPGTTDVVTTAAAIGLAATPSTNGAPTAAPTLSIGPNSAALDQVPAADCRPSDERGMPRPGDASPGQTSCDAGAYELQHAASVLVQATPTSGSLVAGSAASFHLAVANTSASTGTVTYQSAIGSLPEGVTLAPTGTIAVSPSVTAGNYTLEGSDSDLLHDAGNWSFTLEVTKVTPVVTWTPQPLTFGRPLGTAQLDATATVSGNPVPGTFTYTPPAGTVLQPGVDVLHASFTPSTAADYTTATKTATVDVGFTQSCISTTVTGKFEIRSGQAVCLERGGSLVGPVTVEPDGALWMTGGSVTGALRSNGAAAVTLCGSTFHGPVNLAGTTGPLVVGGPGCAGNDFHGPVRIEDNAGAVSFVGNAAFGPVAVRDNSGPFEVFGDTDRAPMRIDHNS